MQDLLVALVHFTNLKEGISFRDWLLFWIAGFFFSPVGL